MRKTTLGVIIGNRGFFPDHLCETGRSTILKLLAARGIESVILDPAQGKAGSVESIADARACADLFRSRRDDIDGILVSLPNFGDERGIANALRWSGLNVPVLIQAFPDASTRMTIADRRDSFCGKLSVCNNLRQYGIRFSLTDHHTVDPESIAFSADLDRFEAVCRILKGLQNLRIGMIGARPAAFNTVRFSEKLLEAEGISVETLDLADILNEARKLESADAALKAKLDAIRAYTCTGSVGDDALERMARMGVAIDRWMQRLELQASAIQCWTALEEVYGIVPCTLMSMMSEGLMPSACETDICGLLGMVILQLASQAPSALLDWNNNYDEDADKGVFFHCSNLPKSFFEDHHMDYQAIIAGTVGAENTCGTIVGRIRPAPFTFCRISTDDLVGQISGYVGEGRFTGDRLDTFGGYGVYEIAGLQHLMATLCRMGFEHHTAVNLTRTADAVEEALDDYRGWDLFRHEA